MDEAEHSVTEITAHIVSAYVSKNRLPVGGLGELIASISGSVRKLGEVAIVEPQPVPAVNPKRSIDPNYLICLDDGKKFKSLKRHLTALGMTPAEYRAKWGLASDYPMVAPNYAAARSALAKQSGLGRKPEPKPVKRRGPARAKAK